MIGGCADKYRKTAAEAMKTQRTVTYSQAVAMYDRANRANLALADIKIEKATTPSERHQALNDLAESFHKNAVAMIMIERANRVGDIAEVYILTREGFFELVIEKWKEAKSEVNTQTDNSTTK